MDDQQQQDADLLPVTNIPPPGKSRGGKWVTFGGERYLVPPMTLLAVQEVAADVKSLSTMNSLPTPEQMQVVLGLVHRAIVRNYPEITIADLAEMIDIGNWQDVMAAVLAISGFKKDARRPGEASAPLTGATSTPA